MKNNCFFAKLGPGFALATLLVLAACASKSPAPVSGGGQSPVSVATVIRDSYTVKSGDTLYSIAREHGMDYRELITLNGIDSPNRITPGRVLKVRPQGGTTTSVASTAPVSSDVVQARPIGAEPGIEQRPLVSGSEALKREPKAGKEAYSDQALAKAQGQSKAGEPLAPVVKTETKPAEPALSGDEMAWIWPANGKMIGTYAEGGNKGIDIAGKAGDPVIAASDGKVIIANFLRGYGKLVIVKHNNTYVSVYGHNQTLLVKEGQTVSKGQKIAEMGNTDADQVKLHFEVRSQGKPLDPLKYLPQR
ncbi:peptidoglycan DD-metalloendopeptidase family protein [Propionivibrio sp.]|uniref:peptidoglycan DD-metalloendopeptidase family protein n=1 Tax=Propionivibrio sp. TaxID=2212460 RepID=UPI002627B0BE|nr:peptidoglycan DD-metalloendopeptidase family protein [Propionivibrio sp.]